MKVMRISINKLFLASLLTILLMPILGRCDGEFRDVIPHQAGLSEYRRVLEQGISCCTKQEWARAILNLDEAVRIDSSDATAFRFRGIAYFASAQLAFAITNFDRALALNPRDEDSLFNRAGAYRILKNVGAAIEDLSACIKLNPTNVLAFKTRAACYSELGRYEEEIADWTHAFRLDRPNAETLVMRGTAFYLAGKPEKAVRDYRQAIEADPVAPVGYNALAWLRATCPIELHRNGIEAVANATKACGLSQWESGAYIDTLAAAYAASGDFANAVKYQSQALGTKTSSESERVEMQGRLLLYLRNSPFRESPQKGKASVPNGA